MRYVYISILAIATLTVTTANAQTTGGFVDYFLTHKCQHFIPSGNNGYFNINPSHLTKFKGIEGGSGDNLTLTIKVFNQVKNIAGIPTRVVNETVTDSNTGQLKEIAINYFSMCKPTHDIS